MGMGLDFRLDEAAHLAAHGLQRFVDAALAEMARALGQLDQLHKPCASGRRIRLDERYHAGTRKPVVVRGCQIEVAKPHHLRLAHRDAAKDLRRIFAHADLRQQRFHLAEAACFGQALRIGRHLLDRFGVGGKPGQAVAGVLLTLDPIRVERAVFRDPCADRGRGALQKARRIAGGFIAKL